LLPLLLPPPPLLRVPWRLLPRLPPVLLPPALLLLRPSLETPHGLLEAATVLHLWHRHELPCR
jgi:hypothetical protein